MGRVMYAVPLIPQCGDQTCWYSCLQMMVRYHRRGASSSSSIGADVDLPLTTAEVCRRNININLGVAGAIETVAGIANCRIHRVSSRLDNIEQLLNAHGPLFYAGIAAGYRGISGTAHAVVIYGIDGDQLFLNDPWPPGVGLQHSMSGSDLFAALYRTPDMPMLSF